MDLRCENVPRRAAPAPASGPSVLIDASSLTRCRHRVYLDTAYRSLLVDTAEDAGVQMRREAAAAYRAEIRDTLVAADPQSWVVVSPSMSRSMQVRATRAACESGVERIWNATFPDDEDAGRRGRCDMLVRDPDGGYIPVLVVNHKVTDPGSGAVTTPFTSWAPLSIPRARCDRSYGTSWRPCTCIGSWAASVRPVRRREPVSSASVPR